MYRFLLVFLVLTFSVCVSSSGINTLAMGTYRTSATEVSLRSCLQEYDDGQYCVMFSMGYGIAFAKEYEHALNILESNYDLYSSMRDQEVAEYYHSIYLGLVDEVGVNSAEKVCIASAALFVIYRSHLLGRAITIDDIKEWSVNSCRTGVGIFNIAMYGIPSFN